MVGVGVEGQETNRERLLQPSEHEGTVLDYIPGCGVGLKWKRVQGE